MESGKITFYSYEKKFGFIKDENNTHEDFFFHYTDTRYIDIVIGDHVSFDIVKSTIKPGKLCATNVNIIE
jgi:cold shock CspA family protein